MNFTVIQSKLKENRNFFLLIMGASLFFGILASVFLSNNYYSQARFIAIFGSDKTGVSKKGLQKISKLAGINFNSEDYQFDVALLPTIVYSHDFFQEITNRKVQVNLSGDSVAFINYFLEQEGLIDKYDKTLFQLDSPVVITKAYEKTRKKFFETLSFDLDYETNVFTIGAKFDNPVVANSVVQIALKYIERYIMKFQLEKKQREINYLIDRKNKTSLKYEKSGLGIAEFLSMYQDLFDEKVKFKYEKLKNIHDINYGVLTEVSEQLELEWFALEERKPIIYIVEKPTINTEPVSLKARVIIVVSLFIGFIVFIITIFRKELMRIILNI